MRVAFTVSLPPSRWSCLARWAGVAAEERAELGRRLLALLDDEAVGELELERGQGGTKKRGQGFASSTLSVDADSLSRLSRWARSNGHDSRGAAFRALADLVCSIPDVCVCKTKGAA